MIETLASQVVSGLATGCIYALVALGFVLIFKATDVVNFAQGEFIMASGFMSYTLLIWCGLPYWLVLLITIPLSGLMGVVLERIVVRPIMDAPIFSIVIATIGASTIMRSSAGIVYGYDVLPLPTIFSKDPMRLGVFRFTMMDIGVIGSSLLIMLVLYLFFQLTKTGTAMRATAQSQVAARLMGVSVRHIFSMTWALVALPGFSSPPSSILIPTSGSSASRRSLVPCWEGSATFQARLWVAYCWASWKTSQAISSMLVSSRSRRTSCSFSS
jgi:branched-chain amino acid transport system permease protein